MTMVMHDSAGHHVVNASSRRIQSQGMKSAADEAGKTTLISVSVFNVIWGEETLDASQAMCGVITRRVRNDVWRWSCKHTSGTGMGVHQLKSARCISYRILLAVSIHGVIIYEFMEGGSKKGERVIHPRSTATGDG